MRSLFNVGVGLGSSGMVLFFKVGVGLDGTVMGLFSTVGVDLGGTAMGSLFTVKGGVVLVVNGGFVSGSCCSAMLRKRPIRSTSSFRLGCLGVVSMVLVAVVSVGGPVSNHKSGLTSFLGL